MFLLKKYASSQEVSKKEALFTVINDIVDSGIIKEDYFKQLTLNYDILKTHDIRIAEKLNEKFQNTFLSPQNQYQYHLLLSNEQIENKELFFMNKFIKNSLI